MASSIDMNVVTGVVGNIASTVLIVLGNKYLYSTYQFEFMVLLSFLHFVVTAIATRVLVHVGFFEYKPADPIAVLPVALGSLGSVAGMNLNLAYNSVGFYQVSKLMCIPVTLVLQFLMFGTTVTPQIVASLAVILFGVGIATVTDVEVNPKGLIFASGAVLCTVLAQIFTGSKQKELHLDAMQLLYHSSPMISVGMFLLMFCFDDVSELVKFELTVPIAMLIFITCILAVGVNITNYLVIGKTSPITYQVVGHCKTVLLLAAGFVLFSKAIDAPNIFGISIAVGGVVWYTELKRRESMGTLYQSIPVHQSKDFSKDSDNEADHDFIKAAS